MYIIEKLIWVVTAHAVGDWALQGHFFAEKSKRPMILLAHSLLWAGCVSIALKYMGIFTLGKYAFLLLGHFACDGIEPRNRNLDQLWHGIQCIVVIL